MIYHVFSRRLYGQIGRENLRNRRVKIENYIAWMKSAYYISTVGNPAISVLYAFSESGLPIGIQIVGRHNDDWGVLQMAYALEQARNIGKRRPPIV
jgi:amidase